MSTSTDKVDMRPMHEEARANYRAVAQVLGTSLGRAWSGVNGLASFTAEERTALTAYYMRLICERIERISAVLNR